MEHSRQEFAEDPASKGEKLAYDAKELIAIAKTQSEKFGREVDPLTLSRRADDDISALRSAIAKEQGAVNPAVITEAAVSAGESGTKIPAIAQAAEEAEVDPRLTKYNEQYKGSLNPKLKACPWAKIQASLLANGGETLTAALDLEQGGVLFGIDAKGRPLISDRGDEPVMKGMNYTSTRDRVLWKHDRNDIQGKMLQDEAGQPVATGYEMFPYVGDYEKSDEIIQYEAHTGRKFVENAREWRSSWLESGANPGSPENPSWPRGVGSIPRSTVSRVDNGIPQGEDVNRGVRRLLRGEVA